MDPAVQRALDSGEWTEKKDKSTGKVYYYHKKTKKTTWDLAKELKKAAKNSTGDTSTAAAASSSSGGGGGQTVADILAQGEWTEKKDKSSGKVYYYNKKTKKTTWDLAKELGLNSSSSTPAAASAAATPTPTAAAAAGSGGGEGPLRFASVDEALKSGEWTEKKDPKSGKSYYSNKLTKKTTWDLAKDLAKNAQQNGGAAAASTSDSNLSKKPKKNYDPKVAVSSGEWGEVKDYMGRVFYVHNETKESTGDLGLYLRIQQAIDDGDETEVQPLPGYSAAGLQSPAASTTKSKKSSSAAPLTSAGGGVATTQVEHFEDWVSLMLHAPGHNESAQRLLHTHKEKLEAGVKEEFETAKTHLQLAEKKISILEDQLDGSQQMIQRQKEEIHQLQCALFYGLSTSNNNGGPSNTPGGNGHHPLPPGISHSEFLRGNKMEERVAYMERLITDLQGHNRLLQHELEQERLAKHSSSECVHCTRADPWRRLVEIGSPRSY